MYGTVGSGIIPDANAAVRRLYAGIPERQRLRAGRWDRANRFPPTAGKAPDDGNAMTVAEAQALVGNALSVAAATRAGIRIPTNSSAQITVSVVDLDGNILGSRGRPTRRSSASTWRCKRRGRRCSSRRADAGSAFNEISAITAAPTIGPFAFPATPTGGYPTYLDATSVNSIYF